MQRLAREKRTIPNANEWKCGTCIRDAHTPCATDKFNAVHRDVSSNPAEHVCACVPVYVCGSFGGIHTRANSMTDDCRTHLTPLTILAGDLVLFPLPAHSFLSAVDTVTQRAPGWDY